MERIVCALGTVRAEASRHVERELLRGDVSGEGPGAKDGRVLRGERQGGEDEREK